MRRLELFTENSIPGCSNPNQTRHVCVRLDARASHARLPWPEEADAICPTCLPVASSGHHGFVALAPAVVIIGLAGCATKPPASDPDALADYQQTNDPLEPTNRVFYAINNGIDTVILRPAAQAYRFVLPGPVRRASTTCWPISARRCS